MPTKKLKSKGMHLHAFLFTRGTRFDFFSPPAPVSGEKKTVPPELNQLGKMGQIKDAKLLL